MLSHQFMAHDNLKEYREKRKGGNSGEPDGTRNTDNRKNVFSFQEHAASTHHYDFRLACDGVLKSWSVPKGPSTDPRDKRLAIQTEDHPMDYLDFEGTIPEGNYGAGNVLLWDMGTYDLPENTDQDALSESIDKGHFKVILHGKKVQGGYAMTRIDEEKNHWLLVKRDDEEADARRNPVSTEPESVKSEKTIKDMDNE